MGLKRTSSIELGDGGSTSSAYSRILRYVIQINAMVTFHMQNYRSQAAANNEKDEVTSDELKEFYQFPIVTDQWRIDNPPDPESPEIPDDGTYNFTQAELEGPNIFSIAYAKIKAVNAKEGKPTEDLI